MEKTFAYIKKITSAVCAMVLTAICVLNLNYIPAADSAGGADRPLTDIANEMAIRINEERVALGLKPMYVATYLNDVSNTRARELIDCYDSVDENGRHLRPSGETWDSIIDTGLVPFQWADENIARGSANVELVLKAWKNSPVHWAAITNPNASHMGVGLCYEENADKHWFWSTIFVDLFDGESINGEYVPEKYPVKPACSGDLSGDGRIDSFDLVLLLQYLDDETYFNELQLEAADLLKDGAITSLDAAVLKKFILGDCEDLPITLDELLGS